jgi:hypothetical protein
VEAVGKEDELAATKAVKRIPTHITNIFHCANFAAHGQDIRFRLDKLREAITEWRTWARNMNKALGFRAKREYIFINRLWSPAALIAEAQKKPKEMLKEG